MNLAFFHTREFKVWERSLMAASAVLFLVAFYLYVTEFPLQRYLFDIEVEGLSKQVGQVGEKKGGLRRQFKGAAEFKSIDLNTPLFDEDTLVTGSDGATTVTLDDGSRIELAPNTMVRLRFETSLSLNGISRSANVNVVTGNVTGEAKSGKMVIRAQGKVYTLDQSSPKQMIAAMASPVPEVPLVDPYLIDDFQILSPKGDTLLIAEKGVTPPKVSASVEWRVNPPGRPMVATLWKLGNGTGAQVQRQQILQEIVPDVQGLGSAKSLVKQPGAYEWEVKPEHPPQFPKDGKPVVATAPFTVSPEFEAIEITPPLVGGELLVSNRLHDKLLKNFDIRLRWKPYVGVRNYRIVLKDSPEKLKSLIQKAVSGPEYAFNKDRVYTGRVYYRVSAPLVSGFVALSKWELFEFSFLSPKLVIPANHTELSRAKLLKAGNGVLFTWEKTHFTDAYEVQIATDPKFSRIFKKQSLKENFVTLGVLPEGKYYWRVKSSSQSLISPPSDVFELTVSK